MDWILGTKDTQVIHKLMALVMCGIMTSFTKKKIREEDNSRVDLGMTCR